MKRIILLIAIFSSFTALAQTPRTYRIEGIAQRFSTALGIPVKASSFFNTSSDTAIVFIDPSDTTTIHFKYKGVAKKLAASNIPWDSITAKPSNFTTTYALSNDVRDSVQNRVPYENATRSLVLGNYRLSARGLLGDTIYTRSSIGGVLANNSGQAIANYGAGGGVDISFNGFAGMDYNRSGSMSNLSFTPKVYTDSLLNLKSNITDSTDLLSKTVRTFGNQSGILGNKIFTNNITANSLIKSSGTADQLLVANGDVQSKADIHNGAFTFDTTGRLLTIQTLGGGTYSVLIPRGTASGAEGITALTSSKVGNLVTVFGDNGSSTTFSIRDADSAITARLSDSTLFNSGRWLPNRSEDSIKVLRALINTKGVGTVTSVTASGPLSSSGGTTPNITITQANTSTNGFLSSTDWNTFNNKVSYTDALARAALSFSAGSGAYNSTTGVITIPTNTNQITNGAGFITLNDSSAINADRWLPNRSEDSIKVIRALANSKGIGSVTSVAVTAGTGISVTGSPITGAGTINVVNTAPDQVVTLTAGTGISISGTYPNFTVTNTSTSTGTVTSVGLTAPTGFNVSSSPITSAGTIGLSFASGYSLPTTASQSLWDVAYNKRLSSASLSSSTLTLTLGDASTVTTSVPTFNQNTTGTAGSLSAVLSKTLGGAGDVNGILKANGSGTVSAVVASDITSLISGTYVDLTNNQTLAGIKTFTSRIISTGGSLRAYTNGSNTQGAGANLMLSNAAETNFWFQQLNASNNIDWHYFNGTSYSNPMYLTTGGNLGVSGSLLAAGATITGTLSGASAEFTSVVTIENGQYYRAKRASGGAVLNVLGFDSGTDDLVQVFSSSWQLRGTGGSGDTKITVNSSGNVGIGTTSPTQRLHVVGGNGLQVAANDVTASYYQIITSSSSGGGLFGVEGSTAGSLIAGTSAYATILSSTSSGTALQFGTSGSVKATLTSSGNFGIGNLATNAKLEVTASSGEIFRADASGGAYRIIADQTKVLLNGDVGIGLFSPLAKLHVAGTMRNSFASGAGGTNLINVIDGVSNGFRTTVTTGNAITYDFHNGANTNVFSIAESGAITASSSVTANSFVYGQGYRFAYAAKSSNYTLTDNDDYINVTSSCTITLPTAVGRAGKRYVIKCVGSAFATIASTSSQTIDGAAASTYSFGGPNYNIMVIYSDGANWFTEWYSNGA